MLQIIAWMVALIACRPQTDHEKVEEIYPNGNAKRVLSFDKQDQLILAVTYHWNQIRETRQEFYGGIPHGSYERWDSNGDLLERGSFANGKREGEFELFYRRNSRQGYATYREGLLQGERTGYYPKGEPQFQEFWDAGSPVQTWTKWYPSGTIQERNSCHAKEPEGMRITYFPTGIPEHSEHCQKGIRQGIYQEFYSDGKTKLEGLFHQGAQHGTWTWYRADSSLWKRIEFQNGLRHGFFTLWSLNRDTLVHAWFQRGSGQVQVACLAAKGFICSDTSWVEGKIQGVVENWDPKTKILTREFWTTGEPLRTQAWRTDSLRQPLQIMLDGAWKSGKREGLWRTWHRNGRLKDSLYYQQNELWGIQSYFDSSGHLYLSKETRGKANQVIVKTLNPKPFKTGPNLSPHETP